MRPLLKNNTAHANPLADDFLRPRLERRAMMRSAMINAMHASVMDGARIWIFISC